MVNIPLIKDGVVINVVALGEKAAWDPPKDCILGPPGGNVGDLFDGKVYTKPVEQEPKQPPAPPPKTPEEKLAIIGLTVAELKTLLGLE